MCWSAPVSFAFGAFDLLVIFYLLSRRKGRDVTYAWLLGSIAIQEWAQFLVWITNSTVVSQEDEDCTLPKAAAGVGTFVGSASLPLVMVWRSVVDNQGRPEWVRQEQYPSQVISFTLWSIFTTVAISAAALTNTYCVMIGPRHHQVWLCARGVYELGGFPLYFGALAIFAGSLFYGLAALDLPDRESHWIRWIGTLCGVVSYGMYAYTLEACSIWCWSAFSVGLYVCFRRPIEQMMTTG